MDDLKFGSRNKRGEWAPNQPATNAPVFSFPFDLKAILKWLPHYFLPYNVVFFLSAFAWWYWVLPDAEVMQTLAWGWILQLLVVNVVAVLLFFGAFEFRLYVQRAQGNRFKYDGRWPSEQENKVFWFRSQHIDCMLRTVGSGVPIWTAIQVAILYAYANGLVPWLTFAENPIYLALLVLAVPLIHETHFFLLHRALHWGPLYRWVHSVHHNSINPSPFSSLAMHPVEQFGYLGVAFWHVILPSNPLIAIYQLHFAGFGSIPGHIGFDRVEVTDETSIDSHAYFHYLHHKHFEVNYGAGTIPWDRWFGTFHDGSKESTDRMKARYKAKKERLAARVAKAEGRT